jgi:hypothetical protein
MLNFSRFTYDTNRTLLLRNCLLASKATVSSQAKRHKTRSEKKRAKKE